MFYGTPYNGERVDGTIKGRDRKKENESKKRDVEGYAGVYAFQQPTSQGRPHPRA